MTRPNRKRALVAKLPIPVTGYPFESFAAATGVVGILPGLFHDAGIAALFSSLPMWAFTVWMVLMLIGGVRTTYGLCKLDTRHIATGSTMVSVMVLVLGATAIYHSLGESGWFTVIVGVGMVLISTARSLHLSALRQELRKAG